MIDKIGGRPPPPGSTSRRNSSRPRRRDSARGGGESRFFSPVSVRRFTRRFLFYLFFVCRTRACQLGPGQTDGDPNSSRTAVRTRGDRRRPSVVLKRIKIRVSRGEKNKRFFFRLSPRAAHVARTSRGRRDRADSGGGKRAYPKREADRPFQSCFRRLLFISNDTANSNDTQTHGQRLRGNKTVLDREHGERNRDPQTRPSRSIGRGTF